LKLSEVGAAALIIKKPIEVLAKTNERRNIETQNAKYFPFYEVHTTGISLKEVSRLDILTSFSVKESDLPSRRRNTVRIH